MAGRRLLASLVLSLATAGSLNGQWGSDWGTFLHHSYQPTLYRASPQNWAAAQDGRGLMYFANTAGILEFDGTNWRTIPAAGGGVRSLAADSSGTLYAGGIGDFGYLAPGPGGTRTYVSLLSRIPEDSRKFADVWSTIVSGSDVYFGSYRAIFRWTPASRSLRVWKPRQVFGRLMSASGIFYVASRGEGLLRLRGDSWEPVPGGEGLDPRDIRGVYMARGGLELATQTTLYRQEGEQFAAVAGPTGALLKDSLIAAVLPLEDGTRLIATARGGLILLSPDGTAWRRFTRDEGFLSDSLTNLFRDREGGLWITANGGIERLELPLTRFSRGDGINGSVYSVARSRGQIYAATDTGLYLLRPGVHPRFEIVPGLNVPMIVIADSAHGLLAGARPGFVGVANNLSSLIYKTDGVYDIGLSRSDPDLAYVVGRGGLFRFVWTGSHWELKRKLDAAGTEFRAVAEDNDGRVWVATQGDIRRVDWRSAEEKVESFGVSQGVPAGFKNLFRIDGKVIAATPAGALEFSEAARRFVPWTVLPARPVSIIREAPDHSLWVTGEGYHGVFHRMPDGTSRWEAMPLLSSNATELYAVTVEPDGIVWAAGTEGFLMRYAPGMVAAPPAFGVEIRKVQSQAGLAVFGGWGKPAANAQLAYRHNTLRFEFAAPFFEDPGKVEYQVRLEGADSEWSAWSSETHRDFTHLFEGNYQFQVRARNPKGAVSPEQDFGFHINAPWYRSWWAWLIYAALALGAVWAFVKWRVQKLEQEKAQLEVIVEERTVEIRHQRDQIQLEEERSQALLLNILPESVASELKATGTVHPQHYDEVTVCFTDFVGFTLSSEEMPAEALVSSLHEYFTRFDETVTEFGLEKLKTIGDAYMFAGGLPQPRVSHAVDAVLAALKMVEVVAELAERGDGAVWAVRIGLHSGPVSAGVVGVRKFAFDIWGNTVNLASRMESSGVAGQVNISARTFELVEDFFDCEPRGMVQTKDKREREMYFVRGLRKDLAEDRAFRVHYRGRFGYEPVYRVGVSDTAQVQTLH